VTTTVLLMGLDRDSQRRQRPQSSRSGRLARVEAGALVGVLAVTALLISLSPPRPDGLPAPTVARQAP